MFHGEKITAYMFETTLRQVNKDTIVIFEQTLSLISLCKCTSSCYIFAEQRENSSGWEKSVVLLLLIN